MQYTAFGPLSGGFSNNPPVEVGLICERLTDLPSAVGPGGARGGPVKAGALFPESEVMHHSCRNGTSRNNVTPTSN